MKASQLTFTGQLLYQWISKKGATQNSDLYVFADQANMGTSRRCEAKHCKGRIIFSGSEFPENTPDCIGVDVERQSL